MFTPVKLILLTQCSLVLNMAFMKNNHQTHGETNFDINTSHQPG